MAAGVEQGAGAVVDPVRHPERDHLTRLTRWLIASVGPFVCWQRCQAAIWGLPAHDHAAEALDLGWARVVLEIDAELGDEHRGGVGVVDVVDRPGHFFAVPGHADLTARIPGSQQAAEATV